MVDVRERMVTRGKPWLPVFLWLVSGLACTAFGLAAEQNVIQRIQTVGAGIEIELSSARQFPVRAQMVVLRIGEHEFVRSRYPADGRLNTLIFTLTPAEFATLSNGDPVRVQYGRGRAVSPNWQWECGTLDKSLLAN